MYIDYTILDLFALYLVQYSWKPRYEDVWGSCGIVPRVLIHGTAWVKWSASRLGRFRPQQRRLHGAIKREVYRKPSTVTILTELPRFTTQQGLDVCDWVESIKQSRTSEPILNAKTKCASSNLWNGTASNRNMKWGCQ